MLEWKLEKPKPLDENNDISKAFALCLKEIEKNINDFKRSILENDKIANPLLVFLQKYELICLDASTIKQYISLIYAKNMYDPNIKKMKALSESYYSEICSSIKEIKPILASYSSEEIQQLLNDKRFNKYRYFIKKLLCCEVNELSRETEAYVKIVRSYSRDTFAELYTMKTSSYEFDYPQNGNTLKLSYKDIIGLITSDNREARIRAKISLLKRYSEDSDVFEIIYNSIAGQYGSEARLRGFDHSISMKNMENEISDKTVNTFFDAVNGNTHIFHKYCQWKSYNLGYKINQYDIGAPVKPVSRSYSFCEAHDLLLGSYYELDNQIGQIVKSFFNENRIDSILSAGKRNGAFCISYIPDRKPYIMTSYTGKIYDVITLAHELGHGIHKTLSSKQNFLNYNPSIIVSEMISGFGELLVIDKLINTSSEEEKRSIEAIKIENILLPIFSINAVTKFEIQAHDGIQKNGRLDFNELCSIYKNQLRHLYSNNVEQDEYGKFSWLLYQHLFKNPFYLYSYSITKLLSFALYIRYLEEKNAFIPKLKKLISSGCSKSPEELFKGVGIILSKSKTYVKILDVLEKEYMPAYFSSQ